MLYGVRGVVQAIVYRASLGMRFEGLRGIAKVPRDYRSEKRSASDTIAFFGDALYRSDMHDTTAKGMRQRRMMPYPCIGYCMIDRRGYCVGCGRPPTLGLPETCLVADTKAPTSPRSPLQCDAHPEKDGN